MSDTIRVPEPNEKGGLDVTSKPPSSIPTSGDTLKAQPDSATAGGTLKKGSSSSKSHLDDIPQEASQYAEDPTRQLTSYILVKQIGKGGMGAVWKAWDKKLTRWVAIKFLLVSEEEDVARFQREAKLAARLRHPNIAPIYEVGEAPATQAGSSARHYLAMEYIDGQTMASASGLPLPELLDLFMKVAQGIEAAHKAGVVHRDLKPANIMLTSDKWPYVMDFGLAKAIQAESSLSVSGAVMGTPAYMPPEQAQGQLDQIDAQSDVYSLGATMYAVLCKKQPFQGQTPMEILMKVCKEDPPPLRSHNPEIPEEVEKIVLKAMAKDKPDRYASSLALAEDLKRYLTHQEIEAKGPSSLKLAAKKAKRNVWPLLVGFLVLAGGGTIGYLLTHKPPPPPPPKETQKDPEPKPPVVITQPPPEDTKGRVAMEWFNAWAKLTEFIDYDDWKAGDATLADRVHQQMLAMQNDAPLREGDVRTWFANQTDKAETQMSRLQGSIEEKRAGASRIVGWCETILAGTKGIEFLKRSADSAAKTRAAAVLVANYKGSFTLRIMVGPYAQVTRLTRNGKDVPLANRFTPLALANLEVGDFEAELTHPQLGKKTVKIAAAQLKDGKTYLITGLISAPALSVAEEP